MIIYSLLAVMLAPAAAEAAPAAADKVVCKRFEVTGSLVKKRRACYTQAEWKKMNERDQDAARNMIDENRGRPSGT